MKTLNGFVAAALVAILSSGPAVYAAGDGGAAAPAPDGAAPGEKAPGEKATAAGSETRAGAEADGGPVGLLRGLEAAYRQAIDRVAPSVVSVEVDRERETRRRGVPAYAVRPGTPASGVLLEGGYVLTSAYHVAKADAVRVRFPGGASSAAQVHGLDGQVDLALLRVEEVPASARPFAGRFREAPVSVGTLIVLVGRGPGGVTSNTGIVSALRRFRGVVTQTDAAINYTNLGGAAIDLDGRLVGIAIRLSGRPGVNSGVGFLCPSERIVKALDQLRAGKKIAAPARPFLGVQFGKEHLDPPGLELARVVADTAAARAGLRKGDRLTSFDGQLLTDWSSLSNAIAGHHPGDKVKVEAMRGDKVLSLEIVLGERPKE